MSNVHSFRNPVSRIRDSLINFVTGLGTIKDPTTASRWNFQEIARNDLEAAYRSNWLARRIVDAPAEDCTREWRKWQATNQQIEAIEDLEKQFVLQNKTREALIRARLYGGAALVMGVDQGETFEPLDFDKVGKDDLKFIVVLNRYELSAGPRIYNVFSPWYTRPEYYTVQTPMFGFDYEKGGSYPGSTSVNSLVMPARPQGQAPQQGQRGDPMRQQTPSRGMVLLHPSRVIEFWGNQLPDWRLAPLGGGWGDSVLQTVDEILKDYGLTVAGIANMINDAKMDVVKIPLFTKNVATKEYRDALIARFQAANVAKGSINTLVMDKEEEWTRIQTNFASLPEILKQFTEMACGAGGIPVSIAMGTAPSKGLSKSGGSGGEVDARNYFDRQASYQNTVMAPTMEPLDQVLIRSALGKLDPNIWYEWAPLYQPEPKEVADIAKTKSDKFTVDVNSGMINPDVLRRVWVNQNIEDGSYPGLEAAIEEFGEEPEVPEARVWSPGYDPVTGKPLAAGTSEPGSGAPAKGAPAVLSRNR